MTSMTHLKFQRVCEMKQVLLLVIFITAQLLMAGVHAEDNYVESPLQTSVDETHNVFVQVGDNYSFVIAPTNTFNKTFQNETDATLVFHYSSPGIVAALPNVTLVSHGSEIFKNASLVIFPIRAGRITVLGELELNPKNKNISDEVDNIFVRVSAYKIAALLVISDVVGWIYFAAWTVSFYPQIYQNWRRKSVRGLSLDFTFINITGFIVYLFYNIGLFWIPSVQDEYYEKYPTGEIPVKLNDVMFTIHAVFACGILVTQCLVYDRGSQTVSRTSRTILVGIYTFVFIMAIVALSAAVTWLTFLDTCSYVKLFVTLIKYVPQAYMNWSRKSTSGWCIGNVLLDFTGGTFSILQMCIISYNHDDWASIFGDFAKFGLGLFSICFDIFFIVQHYCLYRNHEAYEPIDGSTHDYQNAHEDMVTSNHIPTQDEEESEEQHDFNSAPTFSPL